MIITKKAMAVGNGAAVYIPREYLGCQVSVILPETVETLSRKIIETLAGHMQNIAGVYLFGSYARGENTLSSDIDVLIITQDEDKSLKSLFPNTDVRVLTLKKIKILIDKFPVITLPILKEAKTLINPILLEELKNSRINYKNFKWSFEDIKRTIKIIEAFIELDEEDISISHIYSLIMRARVCFMIDCLLNNNLFSNKGLKEKMVKQGLSAETYESYYKIYQKVRNNQEANGKINKNEIVRFIEIIKKYAYALENESKKKA